LDGPKGENLIGRGGEKTGEYVIQLQRSTFASLLLKKKGRGNRLG